MEYADMVEREMLVLINQERAELGLAPLRLELSLNDAAEQHSLWMLDTNTFSHTGIGNSSSTDRIVQAEFDLDGYWSTGENIAIQSIRGPEGISDDVADLHAALMASPGHRANLLNPDYDYIGIGIEIGTFDYNGDEEGGVYTSVIVTQNFASTQGEVSLDNGLPADDPLILGGAANDVLQGTAQDDEIRGAGGDDTLTGVNGNDVIIGGGGNDLLRGGAGEDRLSGNNDDDRLFGGDDTDRLTGGGGADRLYGENGADFLMGGADDDRLAGGSGNDRLTGGAGDDRLDGGSGNDRLVGGGGEDMFVFAPGGGSDVIVDFEDNVDALNLRDYDFASTQDALSNAHETANGVVFNFGDGDRLVVLDATLDSLENDLLI